MVIDRMCDYASSINLWLHSTFTFSKKLPSLLIGMASAVGAAIEGAAGASSGLVHKLVLVAALYQYTFPS